MSESVRVTVTLPSDLLREIDSRERNRSRFVLEALRREVSRRRMEELELSLANPHPETSSLELQGVSEWFAQGKDDAEAILDLTAGTSVRWLENVGWVEG